MCGEFTFSVNLVNYTNPTGLCAECQTVVGNVASAQPVCCEDLPLKSHDCDNTGEKRCDTRFRWTLRPFGASLETRPNSSYYFTDCTMSNSTCPFSEVSTTFDQGPMGFLGVAANPLPVKPKAFMQWTVSL